MHIHNNLWNPLCSYENLYLAYRKARKGKTKKDYVIEFERNLEDNLLLLKFELLFHSYRPKPLETFILRDPKTRKISKSDFKDRIVHHALCNIIEPILDKIFIYDSYANRKDKGAFKALERFDYFKRRITKNNNIKAYCLKADIKHYFDTVSHKILIEIINKKIKDERVIWLVRLILYNFNFKNEGVGMPLGNLTSQFFANVYLNELDYFIKHKLKIKYYLRYVDDFIILHRDKNTLELYKNKINEFLMKNLKLELHPDKCNIKKLKRGISLLGFRVFYNHKLLIKRNIRKMKNRLIKFNNKKIDYDGIYSSFEGWIAYAKHADTYKLRKQFIRSFELTFPNKISTIEINRLLTYIK